MKILQFLANKKYRNPEMVSYWKTNDSAEAKVIKAPEGHTVMQIQGEKYPFMGVPRSILLFGGLSPLKHRIKTEIFNECWRMLEENLSEEEIRVKLDESWKDIFALAETTRYDWVPYESLCPVVKLIWDAMSKIENPNVQKLKEIICFILQEDDAYRFRFQWMAKFFPRFRTPTLSEFTKGLSMLEQGEVIGDMKERERLFKRGFLFMASKSPYFYQFLKNMDWNKARLSKADKYFFRAKYFKVDYPEYQY